MNLSFTPEQEELRREIREFLAESLPAGWEGPPSALSDDDWEFAVEFNHKLAGRGWIAPAWPREYGGLGAGHIEQAIFAEELGYHRAPHGQRIFGISMIGPTLIVHGSEEQKREHLPGITSATVNWCQGYSEPGSGSDLASLETRAVRDGDDYVINGQKIWTTGAQHSDWMFLLARTDPDLPKHKGISFFLLDMKTPGITVRPLINIQDRHEFNQVFFEDVRVPRRNLVGPENGGWYVGMTLLDFERSSIGAMASARRALEELADYARTGAGRAPAERRNGIRNGVIGNALAELAIECEVGRLMSYRIASMQAAGQVPNYEASMMKVFATEMRQRLYNFGVNLLGLYGQLGPESPQAPLGGRIELGHLENVAPTIYSGSNEIQRNIIAQRGLGLPRS
jgi:alkylation response protein AidB-like acyl-CoA dehydrogenase